jgi:hypothetical protein
MSITHLRGSVFNTTNFTYTSGTVTPAVGDLLLAFIGVSRDTPSDDPTMTDSLGGTWTALQAAAYPATAGLRHVVRCFVRNALAASTASMTVTFNNGGSSTYDCTSCVMAICSITGATKTGSAAKRQSYTGAMTTGGTPSTYFNSDGVTACLATNAAFIALVNATNPAGVTPPASWTELLDTGTTPVNIGFQYAARESGFAANAVAWGSTTPSDSAQLGVEIDMSSATAYSIQAQTRSFAVTPKTASLFPTAVTGVGGGARQIAGGPMLFKKRLAFKRPFLLVQSSDGRSPATGKTPTVTISKNGALTFSAPAGTVAEMQNGWYVLSGTIADADTAGPLAIHVTASGANTEDYLDFVEDDGIWRSKVTGATTNASLIDSALVQTAANNWKGRIVLAKSGAADGQASNVDGFDPATDKITFTAIPTVMAVGDDYWII